MARFYASIQGSRGVATRMGTPQSGITGHVRGWDLGARVDMDICGGGDEDLCTVRITSGSNGGVSSAGFMVRRIGDEFHIVQMDTGFSDMVERFIKEFRSKKGENDE